jgi:hypothetical protein
MRSVGRKAAAKDAAPCFSNHALRFFTVQLQEQGWVACFRGLQQLYAAFRGLIGRESMAPVIVWFRGFQSCIFSRRVKE